MSETNERSDSTVLSVRVSDDLKRRLDDLAKTTRRSKSFLAAEAIEAYVELNEWQIEEIKAGLQEAREGKFAMPEEVEAVFAKYTKRRK